MNKKVIILTLPLENNYGGLLQAYALQRVLSEMGLNVVTDKNACKKRSWKNRLYSFFLPVKAVFAHIMGKEILTPNLKKERDKHLIRFVDNNIKTTDFFKGRLSPPVRQIEKYDCFVVGSDQVWRKEYVWVQSYMLSFLKNRKDKRRIAYSGSFGQDSLLEWSEMDKIVGMRFFPLFDAISVREESGNRILREDFEVESSVVIDPTMLLKHEVYERLDGIESIPKREKMLYCYILDLNEDIIALIEKAKYEIGAKQVNFVLPKQKVSFKDKERFVLPSVGEWLSGFRDADYVVTDSFHGAVFSIIFNKQFVCYANRGRGVSRMNTLFSMFDLKDRMVYNSADYSKMEDIDYKGINIILDNKREEAFAFLQKSLL